MSYRESKTPLTDAEVLQQIKEYWLNNGVSPTIRDIADYIGIGSTTAHYHITRLRKDGKLKKGCPGLVPVGMRVSFKEEVG